MSLALVTGARGFIGRHVLLALAARGTRVITIGRDSSSIAARPDHVTLRDVSDAETIRRTIEEHRPATIYHIAGTVQTVNVMELYRANVVYACNVLSAAR